ncbi:MAG TPA: hypothetical protein VHB21_20165 [Minicystis sp.]|nr:hypothetical protein [Minicystis sp.]
MDLAEYARIYHAVYGKPPREADALFAKFGRTRAWFEATRAAVDARASVDPKVAAEMNARVLPRLRLGSARRRGDGLSRGGSLRHPP